VQEYFLTQGAEYPSYATHIPKSNAFNAQVLILFFITHLQS